MKKSCLFTLMLVSILSGCADRMKNPYFVDITTSPEKVKLSEGKQEQVIKVSYLSRDLMESDNRAAIEKKVANSKAYAQWSAGSAAQVGTMAQMTTDLAVGQFDSSAGSTAGAIALGAGVVLGEVFDGSKEYASKAWLPNTYDGELITTREQAQKALKAFSEQQVKKVADTMGWHVECAIGCDAESKDSYYYLSNTNNQPLHADYIYKPYDIAIRVSFSEVVKVKDNDPIHALLGNNIGWTTYGHNSFVVMPMGGITLDEFSKPKIFQTEGGRDSIMLWHYLKKTHIGRDILRTFHSTPYTFQGDSDDYPHIIYHDNVAYTFGSNSNTYIASLYLDESYLLDGKAPVTTPPTIQTPVDMGHLK
ncbi:hypothetical protein [Vibrio parahaemolyticus]|uniref:hypothetical protein n=1 Tax=Vibrio parahaemolyticus TaxID=670 RepID=UPI001A33198E|nr:hypothetical protein [Vibrio parahaemolyticus]MCX8764074.1 hypothetical protein [Vibrio parahaemolyticus]HAT7739456.1 hypothetical protein [Vibrio vulnificus]